MKKNPKSFVSSMFILILTIMCISIVSAVCILGLVINLSISEIKTINIILSAILFIIILFSIFIGSKMVYKVYISTDKIVVKNLWGTHTACNIEDIVNVYAQPFGRGDTWMICIEDNKPRSINMFRKNSLVRFQCSKKSIKILNMYWTGEIKNLPKKFTA